MRQLTDITINQTTLTIGGLTVFLLVALGICISVVFVHFIKPFFLETDEQVSSIELNAEIDEIGQTLRQRRDLTPNTPSATLTIVAEIINSSGVEGVASRLAEELEALGIDVVNVTNGVSSEATIVAVSQRALFLRDNIVEKIGTRLGELRFEDLSETSEVDIRIVIGR